MVTLISCHPYVLGGGPYRYLVFCERTENMEDDTDMNKSGDGERPDEIEAESDTEVQAEVHNTENPLFDADDSTLLEWETRLRTALPAVTMLLAGMIVLIRNRGYKKK